MKKHYYNQNSSDSLDSSDSTPDKYPAWWQNYTTWFIIAVIAIIIAFAIVWI